MLQRQAVVRSFALLLLLFAAVDLFGIDLFSPALCASPISNASEHAPTDDDDDCFCCCGHLLLKSTPQVSATHFRSFNTPPLTVEFISGERTSVYRPPRS